MAKERKPRPVRKTSVKYSIQIYDGDTPQCLVDRLKEAYGLEAMPEGAHFEVGIDYGYASMGDCACTADVYLQWVQDETDKDYNERVAHWEKNEAHLNRIKARYAEKKALEENSK